MQFFIKYLVRVMLLHNWFYFTLITYISKQLVQTIIYNKLKISNMALGNQRAQVCIPALLRSVCFQDGPSVSTDSLIKTPRVRDGGGGLELEYWSNCWYDMHTSRSSWLILGPSLIWPLLLRLTLPLPPVKSDPTSTRIWFILKLRG